MLRASYLFRVGVILLIVAMGLGPFTVGVLAFWNLAGAWAEAGDGIVSFLWLGATAALLASAATFAIAIAKLKPSLETCEHARNVMPLKSRLAFVFVACWVCSLPHAYIALPGFKEALPLRIAGLEAYATGNALAAFLVSAAILLVTRQRPKAGFVFALIAAVIVNAGFIYEYITTSYAVVSERSLAMASGANTDCVASAIQHS